MFFRSPSQTCIRNKYRLKNINVVDCCTTRIYMRRGKWENSSVIKLNVENTF